MSAPPKDEQYDVYVGQIARGVGVSSLGQGFSRLLGYATQVAMARWYGPAQLGFYVLGITLVQIANILSQFGMDNGVVRYVAHYGAEGDARRVRGIGAHPPERRSHERHRRSTAMRVSGRKWIGWLIAASVGFGVGGVVGETVVADVEAAPLPATKSAWCGAPCPARR